MKQIPFDHDVWYFKNIVEISLQIFCLGFCIYIHQNHGPVIPIFRGILVWFWYQGNRPHKEVFGRVPALLFFFFLKSLRRISMNSRLFGRIHRESIWSWVFGFLLLMRGLWLLIQFSYLLLVYSDFLFQYDSVLVGCMFLVFKTVWYWYKNRYINKWIE